MGSIGKVGGIEEKKSQPGSEPSVAELWQIRRGAMICAGSLSSVLIRFYPGSEPFLSRFYSGSDSFSTRYNPYRSRSEAVFLIGDFSWHLPSGQSGKKKVQSSTSQANYRPIHLFSPVKKVDVALEAR